MSKHMPKEGETWRFKTNHHEARVLAVVVDPEGKADTYVVYTFESFRKNAVAIATVPDFTAMRELKPPFNEGDVIEYPSGRRYYVGEGNRLHRITRDSTPMSDIGVAKKIN